MNGKLKNRIRELRARFKITQETLAEKVGVTRQTIFSIENGIYIPSTLLALRLAKVLQTPVEEIFNEKEEK